MLIDKLELNLVRRNLGEEETHTIIDPMVFLDDVFTNLLLTEKIEPVIRLLYNDIVNMDGYVAAQAPVITIAGQSENIRLRKSDVKRIDDSDDGLSNVDNTPDLSKPASKLMIDRWEKDKIPNYILPGYNIMRSWVDPYITHISGYQKQPLRGNPHRVTLASGIYYTDEDGVESIVTVLPQSFLYNGTPIGVLLNQWIDEHNEDVNPLDCHVPIWSRVRTSIGVLPPGDARQEAIDFNIHLSQLDTGDNLALAIREYARPSITLHENNQLDAHQNYRNEIIDMIDDPHVVYSDTTERIMYEYIAWKSRSNLLSVGSFTKEYPTTLSVLKALLERKPGLTTDNSVGQLTPTLSKSPYLKLDDAGQKITLLTSNNITRTWHWPERLQSWFMTLDAYNENISGVELSGPAFGIFSLINTLAWKNPGAASTSPWTQFKIETGPPIDKRNMTVVKHYDYDPLPATFKSIIDSEFPTIWTAIMVAPYSIILRQKGYNIHGIATGDRYNATLTVKERRRIAPLLVQTEYVADNERRILVLYNPINAGIEDSANIIGSSYDYGSILPGEYLTAKNKNFGSSERPALLATYNKSTTGQETNTVQGRISLHNLSISTLDMTLIFHARITASVKYIQSVTPSKKQGEITSDFYVINTDNDSKYIWDGMSWVANVSTPINDSYIFPFSFTTPPAQSTAVHDMTWNIDLTRTSSNPFDTYAYKYQSNKTWSITSTMLLT